MSKNNKQSHNQVIRIEQKHLSVSSGPLPSPEILDKYAAINPGIVDVIITTFKLQVDHRIETEKSVIENQNKLSRIGQHYAFIICFTAIICGTILILNGKSIFGILSILGALGGLTGSFIYGKYSDKQERIEKFKSIPQSSTNEQN